MRLSVVFVLFAVPLLAQQPYGEKINVAIVNVDVSVTRSDGTPVRGLTRDDFELFEDGRRQTITNFYAVVGPNAVALNSPAESPAHPADERFRRKVLVLVDVFHTTKTRRALALANLERMIDDSFKSGEYDWSIAVMGRGVTLALPLTSDKQAIHDTLARLLQAGERPVPALAAGLAGSSGPTTNERIDRAMSLDEEDRFLAATFTTRSIIDALRAFASTSGKKIVLLLTGDIGLNDLESTVNNFGSSSRDIYQRPLDAEFARRAHNITDLRTSIVHEANASGVSVYIFNTEGLQPLGDEGANPRPITNTSAVFWLSKDTGGRLVTGNDGAAALQQFDTASSNYYSLGYRSPHPEDGKYHTIAVRLTSVKGARIDYRSGYSSSPTEAQWTRAMESPVAAALLPTAVPVTLTTGVAQPDHRGLAVPISLKVLFSSLQFLPSQNGPAARVRVYISVFDDIGKKLFSGSFPIVIQSATADANGVMVYRNVVLVSKGVTSQIIGAVRDETTDSAGAASVTIRPE
jgi:VWFA-related protein